MIGYLNPLDWSRLSHDHSLLTLLRRLDYPLRLKIGTGRNSAEELINLGQDLIGVKIANDHQRGVPRVIPLIVICLHFPGAGPFQVLYPPDSRPVIGMLAKRSG